MTTPDPITFARVCGVTLTLAVDSVTRGLERVEENAASLINRPINARRGLRLKVAATTTPTPRGRAAALEGLILGHAHAWSFNDDFHSSRGKGPEAGLLATIGVAAPAPKTGSGRADIEAITYDLDVADDVVEFGDRWMWHGWKYSGVIWQDWQIRSDGAVWVDGVRIDTASTDWLVVGFGSMSMTGVIVDDVALFLFEPDDEMVEELGDWHTQNAWPAFGDLVVDGDLLEGRTLTVIGEVDEAAAVQFADAGAWENAGRALRITLRQVENDPALLLRLPRALVYTDPAQHIEDAAGWYQPPAITRVGVLSSIAGPFGPAAVFDGTACLSIADNSRLDISVAAPMTVCAVVRLLDAAAGLTAIYGKGDVGTNNVPLFFIDAGRLGYAWLTTAGTAGIYARASNVITALRWAFVAVRYDGSNTSEGIELLVDGVVQAIGLTAGTPFAPPGTNNTPAGIGSAQGGALEYPFIGALDLIGVWNVLLTDLELAELYRAVQRKRRPRFFPTGI